MNIVILMATYNGAAYLKEQLESIKNQTIGSWFLVVGDDGSTDDTLAILSEVMPKDKYIVLPNEGESLGSSGNFARLLESGYAADGEYIVLCDQDDVWDSDKLERQLEAMYSAENGHSEQAKLVYSDMRLISEEGHFLHPSFQDFQKLKREEDAPLRVLLVHNFIPGCSMMLNRSLVRSVVPIPSNALMHDWWVAQMAVGVGEIHYLSEATFGYRQHGGNVVGAQSVLKLLAKPRDVLRTLRAGMENLQQGFIQAADLLKRVDGRAEPDVVNLVKAYVGLPQEALWSRLLIRYRLGVHAQGRLRHMLFLMRLVLVKNLDLRV